jgi:ribosomal protein S18 acetylase RimI-like enzyme
MPPQVWVAADDDLEPVSRLLAAFRDWMGRDAPSDESIHRTTAALLRDSDTEFLLASRDGGTLPSGVCQLRYRLSVWTGTEDCWLEDLYVREEARGGGVGRSLVEAAVERARARGCRRIQLDVNEHNAEALALYRSVGFNTESKPPGRTLFVGRSLDP